MKFRLKLPNTPGYVTVNDETDPCTLASLRLATRAELEKIGVSGQEFQLTLNGSDVLEGDVNQTVADLGVVNGDTIRLLFTDPRVDVRDLLAREEALRLSAAAPPRSAEDSAAAASTSCTRPPVSASRPAAVDPTTATIDGEEPLDRVVVNRCLTEPILCRESTALAVPEMLSHSYHASGVVTQYDALLVVLHVMMLESGFLPADTERGAEAVRVPATAKVGHIYRVSYAHPSCEEQLATLTCIPAGQVMSVNGSVQATTFQMSLKPSLYVRQPDPAVTNVASVYDNLPKLSHLFKDAIVSPLLATLQTEEGISPGSGLISMATEVKLLIVSLLDVRSLLAVARVNKEFHMLADEATLWKRLCFTDFPDYMSQKFITESSMNWKEKYKVLYQRRKANRANLINFRPFYMTPPPYANPVFPGMLPGPNPFQPTYPGFPPGIFGGEYDRRPGGLGPGGLLGPHGIDPLAPLVPPRRRMPNVFPPMPGFFPQWPPGRFPPNYQPFF